jgi:phage/plasmid-like protein (TIGR03299 family)
MMTLLDKMYSVREAPWHLGMGTNVLILDTAPETRDDRIAAAGHNFIIEQKPIYREQNILGINTMVPIKDWNLITRDDTDDILHVAKDTYVIVQNYVGHQIFEALSEGARLDDGTGGTTHNGAVCYLSARIDEEYMVKGDDSPMYPYIGVMWSHNGTVGFQAFNSTVRVVCWNTARMAEMESKRSGRNFSFRHTKNVMERIEDAKAAIRGAVLDTQRFVELGNELAAIAITSAIREQFTEWFIPMPESKFIISDRVLDNILDARQNLRNIFDSPTMPEAHRDTAYGLLQAGIEYLDHIRGYRNLDTYVGRTLLREEPMKKKLIPMIRELVA